MLEKLFSLVPKYSKRIQELEKENLELKEKLLKRQEDINKTNALVPTLKSYSSIVRTLVFNIL